MGRDLVPVQPPRTAFHPGFVRAILGLAFVFIIGAWTFLSGSGYIGLVAGVVTFFTIMVLAIPYDLWRIKTEHDKRGAELAPGSFREWLRSDVEIWDDRLSGREAMITALLPIGAVAVGALLFALAFQIGTHG